MRTLLLVVSAMFISCSIAQSQWQQTGPVIFNAAAIAAAPNGDMYAGTVNAENAFAETYGYGFFRSTDNGETWVQKNSGLPVSGVNIGKVTSIVVSGDTILISYRNPVSGKCMIYRSINRGDSWSAANTGITSDVQYLMIGSKSWFAAGGTVIYRSTDKAVTWTPVDTATGLSIFFYLMENNGKIFADGIHSTNDGVTWVKSPLASNGPPGQLLHINGDSLLCMNYLGQGCISTNNGASWTVWNGGANPAGGIRYWTLIDRTIFANDGSGLGELLRSDNLGKSFTGVTTDLTGTGHTGIGVVKKIGGAIYLGTNAYGIYRSDDGGAHWVTKNFGFPGILNHQTLASDGNTVFACGSNHSLFRSEDEGRTWQQSSFGLGVTASVRNIVVRDSFALAATGNSARIYRSSNGGRTWEESNTGLGNGSPTNFTFVGRGLDSIIATSGTDFYRSVDSGRSWAKTGSLTLATTGHLLVVGGAIYAGAGNTTGSGRLYKSTDFGSTWTLCGGDSVSRTISGLTSLGNSIIVTTGWNWQPGIIWRSDDFGSTWYRIMQGLSPAAMSTGILNANGTLLAGDVNILGTRNMYSNANGNSTWQNANQGLPGNWSAVSSMVRTDHYALLILAGGVGVYRRPLADFVTDVTASGPEVARGFTLHANYPNPFNPTTRISFDLSTRSLVTLKVYNLLGQEVAMLVDHQQMNAGRFDVPFDASNLASGVYMYRLSGNSVGDNSTGEQISAVRKMMLVR